MSKNKKSDDMSEDNSLNNESKEDSEVDDANDKVLDDAANNENKEVSDAESGRSDEIPSDSVGELSNKSNQGKIERNVLIYFLGFVCSRSSIFVERENIWPD